MINTTRLSICTCLTAGLLMVGTVYADSSSRVSVIDFEEYPELTPISDQNAILGSWSSVASAGTAFRCISGVLEFDGENDAVSIADRPEYRLTDLTIEAWVYMLGHCSSGFGDFIMIRGDDRSANDPYFVRVLCDGRVRFQIDGNNQSSHITSVVPLQLNTWSHVAAVCDTTAMQIRLYLDGALIGLTVLNEAPSLDLTGTNPGIGIGNVRLPSAYGSTWWSLDARLCDVRLWSHARNEIQIRNSRWHRLAGEETGLVGYWPLSVVDGLESPDLSPTNNPAILGRETGGPPVNMPIQMFVETPLTPLADMNCDCAITVSDIGPFVLALTNPSAYATDYPDCLATHADINADGVVTVSDIGGFVQSLVTAQ